MESGFETEPLVERIRAEFREMPDLRVTVGELQRLCAIDAPACRLVIDTLTTDGFLHETPDGLHAAWEYRVVTGIGAPLIRSVLVAADFGDAAARAVAIGGAIAERCGNGTLRLVHAQPMTASTSVTPQELDAFGREHTKTPFSAAIHPGAPDDVILMAAASADLIVMGTHGRHGPKRWWLGSVAERVLDKTNRPVLVVRANEARDATSPDRIFDRTLVHAATTETGEAALALARYLTDKFGGVITDARHGLVEVALQRTQATILVAAAPARRPSSWMTNYGAPVVRFCSVPILFVPER